MLPRRPSVCVYLWAAQAAGSTCQTYARFLFFSVPHQPLGIKESSQAVKPEPALQ